MSAPSNAPVRGAYRGVNLTMYTTRAERIAYERNTYGRCDHGRLPHESCKRCSRKSSSSDTGASR